jgi:hypothetical protein
MEIIEQNIIMSVEEPTPEEDKTVPVFEDAPFSAKHPNIYGGWGAIKETGKELIPYLKYVDPEERDRFYKLSKQKQVRELLLQNLETVAAVGAKPISAGAKAIFKAKLPKTFEKLQKINQFGKPPKTTGNIIEGEIIKDGDSAVAGIVESDPVKKVSVALKEAKPLRAEQEEIYTKIRSERIKKAIEVGGEVGGEKGYYTKLSKMKGEMDKVKFESIREKIGQEDIDSLFSTINDSIEISEFEKLSAGKGLAKLFGEFGGNVPTEGELSLLNKIFGSELTDAALSKRSLFKKAKDVGLDILNIPRSLMASFDVSAPLRQGLFLTGRPKQFVPAFRDMFKYLFSEKSYAALAENISKRPTYDIMKKSGLAITEMGKTLSVREEKFMSSYAEKIPIIGSGVRASGRAYSGFLSKLRADVFDDIVKKASDVGIKENQFYSDVAKFINTATGRGGLGSLEGASVALNSFFFSPRLMSSRINMLNPQFYISLHPQARKEALKSLLAFGGIAATTASLAALGGAKVGTDPRSANFMKLKFGNNRYDFLGGFQQPVRAAAQLISGQVVSSTTGKVMTLGEGYRPLTRTDIISRFLESKEAPVVSFATALLRGKTNTGEVFDAPTEIANRFVPMVAQDMIDFYKETGGKGIAMALPVMLGVGAMSYGGVQSYGLNGKDHPKLNAELNRLNTSMGYPGTTAFGEDLNISEYKKLKKVTGEEIARRLKKYMSFDEYKSLTDRQKVSQIEQIVDETKEFVKEKMFLGKKNKSEIRSNLKALGYTREESKPMTEEFLKKGELDFNQWP